MRTHSRCGAFRLQNHDPTRPCSRGFNLRWVGFMTLSEGETQEPGALYDSCSECAPDTYFTTFHFDPSQHIWEARWMRGGQGVPVWSANPHGRSGLDTGLCRSFRKRMAARSWARGIVSRIQQRRSLWRTFVYRYDVDSMSRLERTQLLSGKDAEAMKVRICRAGDVLPGLARGQDSTRIASCL